MPIQQQGFSGVVAEVDTYKRAQRVSLVARGAVHRIASITGTMAAALTANSSVFSMRLDPAAGSTYKAYIERIHLQWTTIVAFTTPVTAARRLALYRGSGATPSGGTGIAAAAKADTADGNSQFNSAEGGDIRIASTGALTVTGITFEAQEARVLSLSHVGAAGGFVETSWEFTQADSGGPLALNQGELIAIRNPAAMDAAGTWQLAVTVDWTEGTI